jgi:hypothetical protein
MVSLDKSNPVTPRESSKPAGLALTLYNPEADPQHSSNENSTVTPTSVLFRFSSRTVKVGADPDQENTVGQAASVRDAASVSSSLVSVLDNTHNV